MKLEKMLLNTYEIPEKETLIKTWDWIVKDFVIPSLFWRKMTQEIPICNMLTVDVQEDQILIHEMLVLSSMWFIKVVYH